MSAGLPPASIITPARHKALAVMLLGLGSALLQLVTSLLLEKASFLSGSNTIDINGNSINFTYGAGGTKLKKHAVGQEAGEQVDNTTDYVGSIEYKNQSIEAIYHAEGRIVFKDSGDESGTLRPVPEYYLKDHLGNVRVVFSDLNANGYLEPFAFDPDWPVLGDPQAYEPSELLQENHYYPFGMEMEGPWELSVSVPENKYLFNGKERDKDFGLNWDHYGFRMYDATIGRFTGVDPIADQFAHLSVYNYADNSPISNIDLHGLQAITAIDGRLIGYRVQAGQGPTQIAKDINDNHSNKVKGEVKWQSVVLDNFPKFNNVVNGEGEIFDENNSDYKSGNLEEGDILKIDDGRQEDIDLAKKEKVQGKIDGEKKKIKSYQDSKQALYDEEKFRENIPGSLDDPKEVKLS